ncbi:MAG: hypothetical protein M1148_02055 [Candidatus Thermoplasmatota archaeon]|nr:hypothetical protein [Candidatus Thermoplasmatota archaeon]
MKQAMREYTGKNIEIDKLGEMIKNYFMEEGFITQSSNTPKGYLLQARKGGFFRTILAMDRAFSVTIQGNSSDFTVKIGVSKWLKDMGVAALEAFFLSPLVVFIEVPEALWSFELEHKLWHYIEDQIEPTIS